MLSAENQHRCYDIGQAGNPFNVPPTTDLCNMRGYEMSGLSGVILAIKARSLGTKNLVDISLEGTDEIRRNLSSDVARYALGLDPDEVEGFVKPDGTSSNRVLLDFAREVTGKKGVVCSCLAHKSIKQAVGEDLRVVEVDKNRGFQMQELDLLNALDENVGVLVLTGGTTELGTIEQLSPAVEEKCRELGIWIHLDAAYGGMNYGCLPENYRQRDELRSLAGADLVKSITVCPHKFVGGLGCSIAFLKSQEQKPSDSYIPGASNLAGTTAPSETAFKTGQTIKRLGEGGMQELAKKTLEAAKYFARALKHFGGIETITPVQSGIVPISLPTKEKARHLCEQLRAMGYSIAEPLEIQSAQGVEYGVRTVFTTNCYFDPLSVEDLARTIVAIPK